MKNTVRRQVKDFIRSNETMVNIINYLFTCDYSVNEIVEMLVKNFGCNRQLVVDTLWVDFGMEMSPFANRI